MRILMLGNSLTTSNNMPDMLARLADAEVVVHARGGARLAEHLNPATKMGARTQRALAEEAWDFVVMQEMSHGPVSSAEAYLKSVAGLCQLIAESPAHPRPVVYGTWAYAATCPKLEKLGLSQEEMSAGMLAAFAKAAGDNGAVLADVTSVFATDEDQSSLYALDGVHPSERGSRLAAQVIADAILGV